MNIRVRTDRHGLLDLTHDRYFDVNLLRYDPAAKVFVLPFGEHRKGPYDQAEIRVTCVSSCSVADDANVRIYPLTDILFLDDHIEITSDIPIRIRLNIEAGCEVFVDYKRTACGAKGIHAAST